MLGDVATRHPELRGFNEPESQLGRLPLRKYEDKGKRSEDVNSENWQNYNQGEKMHILLHLFKSNPKSFCKINKNI